MARTKANLGPGARLSDYLSASLLARVYPPELVHGVLDEHDKDKGDASQYRNTVRLWHFRGLTRIPGSQGLPGTVARGVTKVGHLVLNANRIGTLPLFL